MNIPDFLSYPRVRHFGLGLLCGAMAVGALALTTPPNKQFRPNISTYKLPKKLELCGEPVPLEKPEVRKRAERELLLNLQSDGQIMLYLKRSGEFFPAFERILKEEGAPDDLKYLAVAESALFQAQSGKGAVGLWQFIPETARQYGLRVDDFVDERRHPEKSTRAAIRLLKDMKEKYGSWALAACAYNMGPAATTDDITFQKQNSYYDLYLNEETSRYVFRIAIIREIMAHPNAYGYYLEKDDYYKAPETRNIAVATEIPNVQEWAAAQGCTYKDVKLLNPWILKRNLPKPPAENPYIILVPAVQQADPEK